MKIGAMNHPARNPLEEIDWFGRHGFDFVDFTLEPPAADPDQIDPAAIRAAEDAAWVRACAKLIEEEGADQFLVNLLHVLRGCFQEESTA
jgi:hypothetical protein